MNEQIKDGVKQLKNSLLLLGAFVFFLYFSAAFVLFSGKLLERTIRYALPIWAAVLLYVFVLIGTFTASLWYGKWLVVNNKPGRIVFRCFWMTINIIGWLVAISSFFSLPNMVFLRNH